jgi:hypothetical protein
LPPNKPAPPKRRAESTSPGQQSQRRAIPARRNSRHKKSSDIPPLSVIIKLSFH